MLLLRILPLVLTIPTAAAQQRLPGPPPPQDPVAAIAAMLRSDDGREQAWGAYYAGRDQLRPLVPDLQQVVWQRLDDPTPAGSAALALALDALVHMKAGSADMLPAVYERRPAEALVLASVIDTELLDAFLGGVVRTARSETWYAAANLLLQRRSRALATPLLDELRVTVKVHLVDPGTGYGASERTGMSIGCGAGGPGAGLPPWPAYDLSSFGHAGMTVLALGPVPVYYRRIVAPAGQAPAFCDSSIGGPSSDDRIRYLAALAQLPSENVLLRGFESHSLETPPGPAPGDAIARLREDAAGRWTRFLRLLAAAGVIAPEQAASYPPVIEIEVDDRRGRR